MTPETRQWLESRLAIRPVGRPNDVLIPMHEIDSIPAELHGESMGDDGPTLYTMIASFKRHPSADGMHLAASWIEELLRKG